MAGECSRFLKSGSAFFAFNECVERVPMPRVRHATAGPIARTGRKRKAAGYRKSLEYLVKDYVLSDARDRLREAKDRGDATLAAAINAEINEVLAKPLGGKHGVIAKIPDEKLQRVAERAAWLGNDEVHYTRKWTNKDIADLKIVLGLVESIIVSDASYRDLLEDMPNGDRRAAPPPDI